MSHDGLKGDAQQGRRWSRRDLVFFALSGFFVTDAVLAEIIGGKLFEMPMIDFGFFKFPAVVLSVGILPWPLVFVATDLVNEYWGKPAVKRLSWLAVSMIAYAFFVLWAADSVPTWEHSGVTDEAFSQVAGQSQWIIVGSILAFLTSQYVDVSVFKFFKDRTGHRLLWVRATGSTFVSQLVDTFIVQFIGLYLPGVLTWEMFVKGACLSYVYKVLVAILVTPLIYAAHGTIDRYLEKDQPGEARAM